MGKSFSLTFQTLAGPEEIFFEFLATFNPFDGLKPRLSVQKTLGGVNVQDSGIFYSDGKITVSGQLMALSQFNSFWGKYSAPVGDRDPFFFTSYLGENPERWLVVWAEFAPVPKRIRVKTDKTWNMTFQILGKYDDAGELMT